MIKHKILIQQKLKQAIVEVICFLDGKLFVMIEMELEKLQFLFNQQDQIAQQVIWEQQPFLQTVTVSCS